MKIQQAPKVVTGKENAILGKANYFLTAFKQNIEKLSIEVTTLATVKSFLKKSKKST